MSSHREAPEIAKDPVADNTDVYAFVSPDKQETVTLIANYIPLEGPAGGPNFYEFGDDVLYEIHIDNTAGGESEITYQFLFSTHVLNPNTFLYNTGPITSLYSPNWNRRQTFSVIKVEKGHSQLLASSLACPPCNIGPHSTPDYASLAATAVHTLPSGETVFAGQRNEGFYVDLGSIFDLLDLRPFQNLHSIASLVVSGVNATKGLNVHSIAIQLPKKMLTHDHSYPNDPTNPHAVIGVYASASRQKVTVRYGQGEEQQVGPWVQVSRLGNPLFNEVLIPLGKKDLWNSLKPAYDYKFIEYVQYPEVAKLLPVLYPGVFPNLADLTAARTDLVALLLTGLPAGVVSGFQNYTGRKQMDLLRLNMAIPPATSPSIYGILDGDLAGFPNGRRIDDDVVAIELRAIAGATYALVNSNYTPDAAVSQLTDGTTPSDNSMPDLTTFPYLGLPNDGYDHPSA